MRYTRLHEHHAPRSSVCHVLTIVYYISTNGSRRVVADQNARKKSYLRFCCRCATRSSACFFRRRRIINLRERVGGFVVAILDAAEHVVVTADDSSAALGWSFSDELVAEPVFRESILGRH